MEKYHMTWRGVTLSVTYTREEFGIVDHIEIESKERAPLPITETGYKSLFLPVSELSNYDSIPAFVTAWLEDSAKRKGWDGGQLSLF